MQTTIETDWQAPWTDVWYERFRRRVPHRARLGRVVHENTDAGRVFQWDERFLQALWNEQRFCGALWTTDGQRLEVISPGTWNVEAGPDFRNAMLLLDGAMCTGDVEVHRSAQDWFRHGHDRDPSYGNVVLHAVWAPPSEAGRARALPPCFVLRSHLDRPWEDLLEEVRAEVYPYARRVGPGECAVRWAGTENDGVVRFFRAAGLARFSDKVRRLHREGIRRGFEQALYENLFEALGYKSNRAPFRELARATPLSDLEKLPSGPHFEACLFGSAGLLPDPTAVRVHGELAGRARRLWDLWWALGRQPLRLGWRRAGVRPLNSPERRLAAGVQLLQRWECRPARRLLEVFETADGSMDLLRRLRSELDVAGDWSAFANFARRLRKPARLLGPSRTHDILANAMLPFGAVLGRQQGRPELEHRARAAWLLLPALQENRLLVQAAHRLLSPPSRVRELVHRAAEQQGLLQVYQDFCLRLHNDCSNCPLQSGSSFEDSLSGVTVSDVEI
ncbi:MAG: DUF2851 family protein [Kiritimatiellaeota bacterium]|nr:DUF2851 family protein [Kiritimatiellota bacterium]